MLGIFLAAAVICLVITGVRAYRQDQAETRLEQLAENTGNGEEELSHPSEASAEEAQSAAQESIRESTDVPGTEGEISMGEMETSLKALENMGIPIPEKEIDFAELQTAVNPDIYAWIYIPDTLIDYPVLQHPTDNLYYLNYNLDGSRGYPGCIYTEDYNAKDFSDPNTVIYGHNMKNGTMFAGLHKFEDSAYFEEHPYVYIYTEEKLYVYEIFAAYESGNEHILYNNDFANEYVYSNYLEDIFAIRAMNSNIKEGAEVTAEDRIVTLSTCVANKSDRRYLVQGVLLNED
jgi:sortase, SrtB family